MAQAILQEYKAELSGLSRPRCHLRKSDEIRCKEISGTAYVLSSVQNLLGIAAFYAF